MSLTLRGLVPAICLLVACVGSSASALQCAPFAREVSGIQLFGNASTWWSQADGKYERGRKPTVGAVLSFQATSSMRAGHVAVVSEVIGDRVIAVTHANWSLINGSRGQIERNVQVVDVSPNNDWSQVRVWYAPIGKVGNKAYPTNGFIYSAAPRLQYASVAD